VLGLRPRFLGERQPRVFLALTVLGILLLGNIVSWAMFGEKTLRLSIASMADPRLVRDLVRKNIKHVTIRGYGGWVPRYPEFVEPAAMDRFAATFGKYGLKAHTETEFECDCKSPKADECAVFFYSIVKNSPLYAQVNTMQFICHYPADIVHKRFWFFGVWLRISDEIVGQE